VFSLEIKICAVFGGAPKLLQPWKDRWLFSFPPPPRCEAPLEQRTGDLVSPLGRYRCKADLIGTLRRPELYESGIATLNPLRPQLRFV
jgi:hypothetical protein